MIATLTEKTFGVLGLIVAVAAARSLPLSELSWLDARGPDNCGGCECRKFQLQTELQSALLKSFLSLVPAAAAAIEARCNLELPPHALLVTERDHRIEPRRTPRRKPRGQYPHRDEHSRN